MRIGIRFVLALLAIAALVIALGRGRRAAPPAAEGVVSSTEFDTLTRDQLYERARELEIPGRSKMNKAELLEALRGL